MAKINRLLAYSLLALYLCAWGPCATHEVIAPVTNQSQGASYDGNDKNSGILALAPNGGRIVTRHYRDRYNALIGMYGDQFTPPLKMDDGIVVNEKTLGGFSEMSSFVIDKEHHQKMGQMLQWKRDGRPKTGVIKQLLNKL